MVMPNKEEESARHRMVVEEIEIPERSTKTESAEPVEEPKPDILDEGVKVSSQELIEKKEPTVVSEPQVTKKQKSPVFWILIPGIFILGAMLGGIVFYERGVNSIKSDVTPTPLATSLPVITPTSSPSATINVAKYDIAVLNGSGIAGEAGKVKELLTSAGFNVTSTANAATYDFTKTIIKAKATVDASVIQKLNDALAKGYVVGDNQTLAASTTVDIQVVVGSSKAK